jgi:hypothetical protein
LHLPIELGLRDRFRLPGQRSSRSRIVEVSGHKVDVQVRHQVSQQLVVHVAWRKHPLDHPPDGVDVVPIRGGFRGSQACERRDVMVAKDDDRVAASDGVPLEMRVAGVSHIKGLA